MPTIQLQSLGSHQTLLRFPEVEFLFSYETLVAAYVPVQHTYYRTAQYYSTTTTRHINRYVRGAASAYVVTVPQEYLEDLLLHT